MPKVHLKTTWIVLDGGKLTDILTARKTFDDVVEYAKELYRATRMNFTEKALLAHYNSGTTVREAAFAQLPVETQYTSALYERLRVAEENIGELAGEKNKFLAKQFAEGPQYVIVGIKPTIEIRRVTDIEVDCDENGTETVRWSEPGTARAARSEQRFASHSD